MSELPMCFGSNWKPDQSPPHDHVRLAVNTIRAHLYSEWISDGCKADHAFGCASCQAVLLERELDGLVSWLDAHESDGSPPPKPSIQTTTEERNE